MKLLSGMLQTLTNEQSTLVQVMVWCRQATGHYLSWCWPRSLSLYDTTRPHWVNDKIRRNVLCLVFYEMCWHFWLAAEMCQAFWLVAACWPFIIDGWLIHEEKWMKNVPHFCGWWMEKWQGLWSKPDICDIWCIDHTLLWNRFWQKNFV